MPDFVHLDDISFGDPDIDLLFRSWREAIENSNRWNVTGPGFEGSPTNGFSLKLPSGGGANIAHGVVTTELTAAPDANTMGHGSGTIRTRDGYALTDSEEDVEFLNEFQVVIPVTSRVLLGWDGDGWVVIGADCPIEPEI